MVISRTASQITSTFKSAVHAVVLAALSLACLRDSREEAKACYQRPPSPTQGAARGLTGGAPPSR
eukprot:14841509-Alexandrium_andersonii.AAC.1